MCLFLRRGCKKSKKTFSQEGHYVDGLFFLDSPLNMGFFALKNEKKPKKISRFARKLSLKKKF